MKQKKKLNRKNEDNGKKNKLRMRKKERKGKTKDQLIHIIKRKGKKLIKKKENKSCEKDRIRRREKYQLILWE